MRGWGKETERRVGEKSWGAEGASGEKRKRNMGGRKGKRKKEFRGKAKG